MLKLRKSRKSSQKKTALRKNNRRQKSKKNLKKKSKMVGGSEYQQVDEQEYFRMNRFEPEYPIIGQCTGNIGDVSLNKKEIKINNITTFRKEKQDKGFTYCYEIDFEFTPEDEQTIEKKTIKVELVQENGVDNPRQIVKSENMTPEQVEDWVGDISLNDEFTFKEIDGEEKITILTSDKNHDRLVSHLVERSLNVLLGRYP